MQFNFVPLLYFCIDLPLKMQVWAYEVLGVFAPENSHDNENVLPWAAKWGQECMGSGERKGDLRHFRLCNYFSSIFLAFFILLKMMKLSAVGGMSGIDCIGTTWSGAQC